MKRIEKSQISQRFFASEVPPVCRSGYLLVVFGEVSEKSHELSQNDSSLYKKQNMMSFYIFSRLLFSFFLSLVNTLQSFAILYLFEKSGERAKLPVSKVRMKTSVSSSLGRRLVTHRLSTAADLQNARVRNSPKIFETEIACSEPSAHILTK